LHLLIGIPLNAWVPKVRRVESVAAEQELATRSESDVADSPHSQRTAITLAFVFGCIWFVSTAMAAHMPLLLQASGVSLAVAVAASALIGPAQVGARMLEYGLLRRFHPLVSARLAAVMHPIGVAIFTIVGAPAAAVFTILYGAGNGILTISTGTLPLVLFGPHGYGQRQGLLIAPARIVQASAPWLFGLCINEWGAAAIWLSASLCLAAFAALMSLPKVVRAG
ncbi:MAG: MFS transporter, partial [Burkholderiaceae bacterium]